MSQTRGATLHAAATSGLAAIPGLVHGFEQRLGPPGWETRAEGRRRVSQALAASGRLFLLKQVHGAAVRAAPWQGTPEGDAATAERPGLLLGIETADCLPILIADAGSGRVAAIHAGWRGTAAGVARRAVAGLVDLGSSPDDLVAALGPAIGPCCYEVGDELRAAFGPDADAFFRPGPRGRPHLDVRGLNVAQLLAAGLRPERIDHVADCTSCRADLYHSYRREGKDAGRMISFVGFAWDPTRRAPEQERP
jgi:YfiH family protein